ncbi:MAG: dephospho-CoA kinase [Gammaproteobacteria bacterium]|jgi:dephospho-CoA kinase
MLIIGLTGGIGSGKSTVANLFKELNVPVFDTDVIARELVEPGQPALNEITRIFGANILLPDGRLDRQQLKERIFNDERSRKQLESVLHPRIRDELLSLIHQCGAPYCVAVIPLLVEHNWQHIVDRVLVVDTDEASQYQRVKQRDHLSEQVIAQIIRSQASREQRLAVANDVIHNNGDLNSLKATVQQLHHQYLDLAHQN